MASGPHLFIQDDEENPSRPLYLSFYEKEKLTFQQFYLQKVKENGNSWDIKGCVLRPGLSLSVACTSVQCLLARLTRHMLHANPTRLFNPHNLQNSIPWLQNFIYWIVTALGEICRGSCHFRLSSNIPSLLFQLEVLGPLCI